MSLILLGFGSKQDSRAFCLKKFLLHKVSDLAWDFFFLFLVVFSSSKSIHLSGKKASHQGPATFFFGGSFAFKLFVVVLFSGTCFFE